MVAKAADLDGVGIFGMRVLVEKVEIRNKSGLYLPDSAKDSGETANVARVVLVGDGRFIGRDGAWIELPMRLKVGQLVVVDPKFILPVRVEGHTYGLLEEEHVLLVLDREMEVL